MQIPQQTFKHVRQLLWQFLALTARGVKPALHFQSTSSGLAVRVVSAGRVLIQQLSTKSLPRDFSLPFELLDRLQSARGDVKLIVSPSSIEFAWLEQGVPRWLQYGTDAESAALASEDIAAIDLTMSQMEWATGSARLQQAMSESQQFTDSESTRYSLSCVQLDRQRDRVVATDGRQLYLAGDLGLPPMVNVNGGPPDTGPSLVPSNRLFRHSLFQNAEGFRIGFGGEWMGFHFEGTTIMLKLCTVGRLPNVDYVMPQQGAWNRRLTVDARDRTYLLKALPILSQHRTAALTMDLNGHVAIRSKAFSDEALIEVRLKHSVKTGADVRWVSHAEPLQRAMQLQLQELLIASPTSPVMARDDWRTFVWMTLDPAQAVVAESDWSPSEMLTVV